MDRRFVSLVWEKPFLGYARRPNLLQYNHKGIKETIPCKVVNGKYFNLRTGEEVKKQEGDVQEWPIATGSVFCYDDGAMFLVSRRYADGKLLWLSIKKEDIRPTMFLYKVKKYDPEEDKKFY